MADDGLRKGLASYGDAGFSLFLRKAFIKAMGYSDDALDRPIVGITNTYSDFNACHRNVPELIEAVKRGVMLAGGLPIEFPTISIARSPSRIRPRMYLRNLMAMDTEEMIRAQPMDSVVLIGGCDKTVPAQLMARGQRRPAGRSSCSPGRCWPAITRASVLGACTDCRRFWAQLPRRRHRRGRDRSGQRPARAVGRHLHGDGHREHHGLHHRSAWACAADERDDPGAACRAPPLGRSERRASRPRWRRRSGRRPSEFMTPDVVPATRCVVLQAIGGSTNGLIHLTAIAGRAGIGIDLDAFDQLGREVPVLVDLKPSGEHYMEHFHQAGGVPTLLRELGDLIDLDAQTITGATLREIVADAEDVPGQDVDPPARQSDQAGRRASPCCTAISRRAAPSSSSRRRRRSCCSTPAARWCSTSSRTWPRASTIPTSTSPPTTCWCCATPARRARRACRRPAICRSRRSSRAPGVKDMVRISDARMSGTAFGTIVLHITPESAVGGPLALVKNGDMIRLDVAKRSIELLVDDAELDEAPRGAEAGEDTGLGQRAAMRTCSMRRSCRPTRAATSISCARTARVSIVTSLHRDDS